jgi:hypothetical protein
MLEPLPASLATFISPCCSRQINPDFYWLNWTDLFTMAPTY